MTSPEAPTPTNEELFAAFLAGNEKLVNPYTVTPSELGRGLWSVWMAGHTAALHAKEAECARLRLPPEMTQSDHPGCVFCMGVGTPVRSGEVCPECGDRLPTKRERDLEAEIQDARSLAFNLLPDRTEDDAKADLCEQIDLLGKRYAAEREREAMREQECAWLIESDETSPRYWDGAHWDYDVNKAIRFVREQDANAVLHQQQLTEWTYFRAKVTEHMWPLLPRDEPPAKEGL